MTEALGKQSLHEGSKPRSLRMRQVEGREWWLWGCAVVVTLALTFGILSLTFPGFHFSANSTYSLNLKEWVRGLAALVLLFDLYTVYQQRELQRMRRRLAEREHLFEGFELWDRTRVLYPASRARCPKQRRRLAAS